MEGVEVEGWGGVGADAGWALGLDSTSSSSVTVGVSLGVEALPLPLDKFDRRRMKRPAREDFFFSLFSSPEPDPSVVEGEATFSRSRLKEERRLLIDNRCVKELFCCTEGDRVGDREDDGGEGAARASDEGEVRDLRLSLMKSLTTVKEDRRDFSGDSALLLSLDKRLSRIVSLVSLAKGVHCGGGVAFW